MWTNLFPSTLGSDTASNTIAFFTGSGLSTYTTWLSGVILAMVVVGFIIRLLLSAHK